jgi:hypothetical protein
LPWEDIVKVLDELKDDYTNEMDKAVKASLMQNYLIIGE